MGATHVWFRERSAFDYFSIYSYYPSKDNIYLLCSKGETHLYLLLWQTDWKSESKRAKIRDYGTNAG